MAAVIVARRRRRHDRQRRERIFSVRVPLFGMAEEKTIETHRLSGDAILELLREVGADLDPVTRRSPAVPAVAKLLATLHFLVSGSFQRTVTISSVLNAMCRRMGRYIQFPRTQDTLNETKHGFYAVAGFPKIIGAIDCTHVQLVPPSDREHIYRNRKHTHSLNVQVVCDSKGIITNVVAKYPGSVDDSFILRNSALFSNLRDAMKNMKVVHVLLLGDSEHRYNQAHISTRNIVERTFGVLKSWFRCLDRTGGALLYSPQKVAQITIVCCILHNIAKRHGIDNSSSMSSAGRLRGLYTGDRCCGLTRGGRRGLVLAHFF
uniref:DDE Tnp4 domain-containing protein n=1 Tax=Seriola lalandi dorsalis TaxID=1841481 RepID=A0A3B4Y3T8_SERLL